MSRSLWLLGVLLGAASLTVYGSRDSAGAEAPESSQPAAEAQPAAEQPPDTQPSAGREAEERIRQALSKPIGVDFHETPLDAAAAFLADACGIPVLLDLKALKDVGLKTTEPVSLHVSGISARAVLRLMLRQLDLAYIIRDEVLLITTPEEAEDYEVVRVYPVGDIVGSRIPTGEVGYDYDGLVDVLRCCIAPETWGVGNDWGGSIGDFVGVKALAFAQAQDVHEQVASLLAALRSVAQQTAEGKLPGPILFEYCWPEPPAYEATRKALERKVSFEFQGTPLQDVADHLQEAAGVNFVLDRKALDDVGILADAPVSMRAADVPLRSALETMLRDLDLTYQLWDEVILITTPEEAEAQLTVGIYPVGDLLARRNDSGDMSYDYDSLIDFITGTVGLHTWNDVGGPGSILPAEFENINALVVSQPQAVHGELMSLLAAIRKIAAESTGATPIEPVMLDDKSGARCAAAQAIQKALSQKVDLDFVETPLPDVLDFVKKTSGIDVQVDQKALTDVGIPNDTPVTIRVSGITLRSALALMLRPLKLAWVIKDGALLITTLEEAETDLIVGIYPVGDLVVCRDENDKLWDDYDPLIEVLTTVWPESWDSMGGAGSISGGTFGAAKVVIIRQTREVHQRIGELLRELRSVAAQSSEAGQPPRRSRPQPLPGPAGPLGGGFF